MIPLAYTEVAWIRGYDTPPMKKTCPLKNTLPLKKHNHEEEKKIH